MGSRADRIAYQCPRGWVLLQVISEETRRTRDQLYDYCISRGIGIEGLYSAARIRAEDVPRLLAACRQSEMERVPERVDDAWLEDAACLGYPEDWFFPEGRQWQSEETRAALAVCSGCPVRALCLERAMRFERGVSRCHGIWGGTTAMERRSMRRAALQGRVGV